MPTWLSDPNDTFYVFLFVLALIAIGVWLRNRDKRSRFSAIAAVVVFALFLLCDRLVESPREEAVRKVQEISTALNERNTEKLMANISESFEYKGKRKSDVRRAVDLVREHNVRTAVWDFERARVVQVSDTELDIVFNAKSEGPGANFAAHFKTRFTRDPDGKWRVKTFTSYDVLQKEQGGELPIPGF